MTFEKDDVYPGAILKIEVDGEFDGYAKLIEPAGRYFTEMISDKSPVIVGRRWLIEFVPVEETKNLSNKDRFTQINQKCRTTHRTIKFVAGEFLKAQKEYGLMDRESNGSDPNKELILDDFNGIF